MIAAAEGEARRLGAEEVYIAAAPDLARDCRLIRIEGETVLGESFALRATVAYKGTWIRLMRTLWRDNAAAADGEAAARLAAAVAELPSARGFASLSSWLVEGCRIAQPLAPLMGSRVSEPHPPAPRALVSVQAGFESTAGRFPRRPPSSARAAKRRPCSPAPFWPFCAQRRGGVRARACRAIAISAVPPNSMLMPTSNPSAHTAVPGSPIRMMAARRGR
jgi:hypothetical protein